MFIALYSVFIFCLFSDKSSSENQDEGSIEDSGEQKSDESRFCSQAKKLKEIRWYNDFFCNNRFRYLSNSLPLSSQHVRDMLFSVSHQK